MRCYRCGTDNRDDEEFCVVCGAQLVDSIPVILGDPAKGKEMEPQQE
ncbi:MAG: zinc-ribbon domain-containing protein [Syntrophothermus sp.]